MQSTNTSITRVGSELVKEANSKPDQALPLSTQLFPYAFIASRTMSFREISEWLQKTHGVSLSAMALSRALRSPDLHLSRLAGRINSLLQYVCLATKSDPMKLLYGEAYEGISNFEQLLHDHQYVGSEEEHDLKCTIETLSDLWLSIPHEVTLMLREHLDPDEEDEFGPTRPEIE